MKMVTAVRRFVLGLLARLNGSPAVHAVPWPVAQALSYVLARLHWLRGSYRRAARAEMACLLEGSVRAGEVDRLAFRYAFERTLQAELRWRPERTAAQRVDRFDRLSTVVAEGRPIILSHAHHAEFYGLCPALNKRGVERIQLPVADTNFDGRASRSVDRARDALTAVGGNVVFRAVGSYQYMIDVLRAHEVLCVAWDVPGSTEVDLLGRRVAVASGTARLAIDTGAVIVPITAHRDRRSAARQFIRIGEPIEASQSRSIPDVTQELVDRHAQALLDWPEAVQQPRRRYRQVDPIAAAAAVRQPS